MVGSWQAPVCLAENKLWLQNVNRSGGIGWKQMFCFFRENIIYYFFVVINIMPQMLQIENVLLYWTWRTRLTRATISQTTASVCWGGIMDLPRESRQELLHSQRLKLQVLRIIYEHVTGWCGHLQARGHQGNAQQNTMLEWAAHHRSMIESCLQILETTEDGKLISIRKGYSGCGIFNEKRWKR